MSRMSSRLGFRDQRFADTHLDVDTIHQLRRHPPDDVYYDVDRSPTTISGRARKYPNFTDLRQSRGEDTASREKRRKRERLAEEFAETTTLQGIAYIHRSRKWYRVAFWLTVFLAAVAATTLQTYSVFNKYYSYLTTASVGMGYDKLAFPTVTICNMNPIRRSASSRFSEELENFFNKIRPKDEYLMPGAGQNTDRVKRDTRCDPMDASCVTLDNGGAEPPTAAGGKEPEVTLSTNNNNSEDILPPTEGPPQNAESMTIATTTPTTAGTTNNTSTKTTVSATTTKPPMPGPKRHGPQPECRPGDPRCGLVRSPCDDTDLACKAMYPSLYDEDDFGERNNYTSIYEEDNGNSNDTFGTGAISRSFLLSERLKEILSKLPRDKRAELGHQAETMILSCEFNGRKCYYWDTVQHLSGDYGNCYSFNSAFQRTTPYRARNSGATFGFTAVLYIEGNEYIPYLSQGRGMRIVIHPFNTMPFAVQTGKSLKPGEETYIGLRMLNVTRKGEPYGKCGDDGNFTELFGYKYTAEGCINTCLVRVVFVKCGCYLDTEPELYNPLWASEGEPCRTEDQMKCAYEIRSRLELGKVDCQCDAPCNAVEYTIETSHNMWPDVSLWYELVNVVCERNQNACDFLKRSGLHTDEQRKRILMNNFLRVHVYFQDLNYQIIEEKPEYELEQFLSDIGGTMGLWVGASVITLMELFYFVIWLIARCLTMDK